MRVQAWAFGGNEYQQATGEPNEEGPGHDVVTPQPCLQGIRVSQVAAGGMHSVALTDEGEVRAPPSFNWSACGCIIFGAAPSAAGSMHSMVLMAQGS